MKLTKKSTTAIAYDNACSAVGGRYDTTYCNDLSYTAILYEYTSPLSCPQNTCSIFVFASSCCNPPCTRPAGLKFLYEYNQIKSPPARYSWLPKTLQRRLGRRIQGSSRCLLYRKKRRLPRWLLGYLEVIPQVSHHGRLYRKLQKWRRTIICLLSPCARRIDT
jgi:hypothetical protein